MARKLFVSVFVVAALAAVCTAPQESSAQDEDLLADEFYEGLHEQYLPPPGPSKLKGAPAAWLDEAPPWNRRQLRSYAIKHRRSGSIFSGGAWAFGIQVVDEQLWEGSDDGMSSYNFAPDLFVHFRPACIPPGKGAAKEARRLHRKCLKTTKPYAVQATRAGSIYVEDQEGNPERAGTLFAEPSPTGAPLAQGARLKPDPDSGRCVVGVGEARHRVLPAPAGELPEGTARTYFRRSHPIGEGMTLG